MKLRFWGVRGSRPTSKSKLLGYGGHTTSMEFVFEDEDFHIFLDGGSGLSRCCEVKCDIDRSNIYFLITHTHWDHILGFPYFEPFRNPKIQFTFFSSTTSKATFSDLFFTLNSAVHLPLPPFLMRAKIRFVPVTGGATFDIEDRVQVRTHQINHQNITLGYRLEYKGNSVAVITDNAPIDNGNYLGEGMKEKAAKNPKKFEEDFNAGLTDFLRGVHTAVFDTHFTEKTLIADWGHSTPERALEFCKKAQVKRLILHHHAPEDNDPDVDQKVLGIKDDARKHGIEVVAAKEGDEWKLSG